MQLSPLNNATPVRHPAPAAAPAEAPKAPAIAAKAQEGGLPEEPKGAAKWAVEKLKKVGGDISKLPTWEKVVISVLGFFAGWKANDLVHKYLEKKEGETYDKYGQDQYRALKSEGTDALVAALAEKHSFTTNVKDWDILQKKWGAFNTFTVLSETALPTLGTHNGKENQPVALIALAGNKTADENAIKMLAADIKRRGNGAPAKQAFYAEVVKNLKDVHGVTVTYDQQ